MISYEVMKRELKRLPHIKKQAIAREDWEQLIRLDELEWTLRWILERHDND